MWFSILINGSPSDLSSSSRELGQGDPFGVFHKAKLTWDSVIEKIKCQLASWKILYLFEGSRLTLMKSTISNLPTYFMSLFPLPTGVANLQLDFLWGGQGEEFKYHLVRSSTICTPIFEGGLGIRNLLNFNHALLGKWFWHYSLDREAWWRVVVDTKYGSSQGGWCSREPVGAYKVRLWKNIIRVGESFPVILDMRREMALGLDSRMIYGVGTWSLRSLSKFI